MIRETEILERWDKRIVPNNLDNADGSGVAYYLQKWGKNISDDKLEAFAELAKKKGLPVVAEEFLANTSYGWFKRSGDDFIPGFSKNFIAFYLHGYNPNEDNFDLFKENIAVSFYTSKQDWDQTRERLKKRIKNTKWENTPFAVVRYRECNYIVVCKKDERDILNELKADCIFYLTGEPIFLQNIPEDALSYLFEK